MRFIYLVAGFMLFVSCTSTNSQIEETESTASQYDSLLAAELGADQYGMKMFIMAFLKSGPNREQDSAEAADIQRAHMDNIIKMAEEGTLVFAGPFGDDSDIQGIYIFDVPTLEEAEKLTNTDPAVKSGRLVMELHPLYGSAALKMVNEWSKKIAREPI